jgi:hypothetical protein
MVSAHASSPQKVFDTRPKSPVKRAAIGTNGLCCTAVRRSRELVVVAIVGNGQEVDTRADSIAIFSLFLSPEVDQSEAGFAILLQHSMPTHA